MSIDLSVLVTNANKLDKYINKNEKQEQDKKDKQLYNIIERKVKKEKHKHEKPRSRDGTLKECKRLFKEGASPEVLTKLEESLREQGKYHRYYVQCFLPVLGEVIEQLKKISDETKNQVRQAISEVTKSHSNKNRKDNESESGYCSNFENEVNGISDSDNDVQLLKAIKNGNSRKFRKYLKDCTNVNSIKDEKGNNILHLIASLEKEQKCKFLGTLIKTVTKEDLAQLVDSENQEGKTPFQVALINKIIKGKHDSHTIQDNDKTLKFLTKLLEYGASSDNLGLSTKELQYLKEEQKTYYCDFLEKLAKSVKKPELKSEIRTKIKEIIPHTINTPDSNDNYQLHLAIKDKDKKSFKELLKKGADINLKDANGNNALHHIALLTGKQKVTCLKLISALVKERKISEDKLDEAIKATNRQGNTPLELALKKKAEKKSIEYLLQETIFDLATNYDNTTKFCAALLQNGANPDSLWLEDPELHTKKYYLTLRDLKDCSSTPQKAQEKAKELKEKLEEKYHCGTASKKCQSGIKKLGSGVKKGASAVWKCIDPGRRASVLLAITVATTIITMVTLSCFQGQIAIGAALPIIAITGVVCLIFTLGLSGIRKHVKELTNDQQTSKDNLQTATQPENVTEQQNLANNSAAQEQSEHTESPATKMSDISILRFINKLDELTNKFSFPGR
ncbi:MULTISPECIES: ankyrin repeat domain-containing protein [Wolbachia]|uniref:ankyrin repeat domain-containing protein n=1 Tax=Wolbachia TaxID=953 RepID=UPI0020203D66|nr:MULTISPECIES: ankyrin repeat domain-containing protein [unclassified Wolbachia]URG39829.1 ankyrin repeat domain-containing protein [Wolbachia endosymbiont of Ostrinia furnacalis]URG40848.1 ankyrin repeat domain-containing protein [Wolbachia endosymbiont of Ostrinia scapulalis]